MKSFKVLMFLTLAAALSCGANGSPRTPTNVTTDGYPTDPSPGVLKDVMNSLQGIGDVYFKDDYAKFAKEYVNRLAWVRPYNYVVCFVDDDYKFDGIKGQDWDHKFLSAPQKDAGPHPPTLYEVVVGGSGTFTRKGESGYQNVWAWNGFVASNQDMKSNVVTFVKPPTGIQAEGAD